MTTAKVSNPFHPEAVATYGQVIKTCENLGYMGIALDQLNQYLINYPSADDGRYGAAIGLRGAHGSGKTHLLMWLAEKAKGLSTIQPIVLYAKADRASFVDLYTQLLSNLSREKFQELLSEALKKLAQDEVGKARASEVLDKQIAGSEDLERLSATGKIDLEQLVIQLQVKLDSARTRVAGVTPENPVPGVIPRTLTMISDPNIGDKAYQWLIGKEVTGLADLNLSYHLFEVKQTEKAIAAAEITAQISQATDVGHQPAGPAIASGVSDGNKSVPAILGSSTSANSQGAPVTADFTESSIPDITAVNGLETVAALLLITERPLIVLIDQFEVLLRADPKRQQTLFSVIKKMVEQLNLQNALTFIAGNNEPWEALTPDVLPRLRLRDPLLVGNLSFKETKHLLEAYTSGIDSQFTDEALVTIHDLSGGNPREIIRIAFYAYNDSRVNGDLAKVDDPVLIQSASDSRTVEDRNKLALRIVDNVLGELRGEIRTNLNVESSISIDRLLVSNDQPRVALIMMKATDKLSEIDSARRFNVVKGYLEKQWPGVPLVCVSVGYSSNEVSSLIASAGTVLVFDENNFAGQLRKSLTELLANASQRMSENAEMSVLDVLKSISQRLNMLETERVEEPKKIAERFSEATEAEAEPMKLKRASDTRWEMINALDRVQEGLRDEDADSERGTMRSLMVANEATLQIKQIDYLGGLYLEVLAEVPSRYDDSNLGRYSSKELRELRTDILRELRRLLRGKRAIDYIVERPLQCGVAAVLILSLVEVIGLILYFGAFPSTVYIRIVPVVLVTIALVGGITYLLKWRYLSRWERHAKQVRYNIEDRTFREGLEVKKASTSN